jgi:hypothetical protein
MAIPHESLALQFAPELYYEETKNPYRNIGPEDMGGVYWRAVPSSVSWADVCIQYIVYFRQQKWVPSVLSRFSGKLPGNHLNDYVPLFLYFKKGKPVRVAFDICHYEAVGEINTPSSLLPRHRGPSFQVRNFYRGLLPLKDSTEYSPLGGAPIPLSEERLSLWWEGFISKEIFDEDARLIIKEKLGKPFKKITTFRDRAGKLGFVFHWIFQSAKEYHVRGLSPDVRALGLQTEKGIGDRMKYFSHEDIEEITEFVDQNIFAESQMPEYLAFRGHRKFGKV